MFVFIPKSYATIWCFTGGSFLKTSLPSRISTFAPSPFTMVHSGESLPSGSQSNAAFGVTSFTKSDPAIGGALFARATAASTSSSLVMHACIAPRERRCFVSARVSTPWMPGIFHFARYAFRSPVERQLLGIAESSSITKPRTWTALLSSSSAFTP